MRFIVMFVTAVCVLFLIKLRWPKKKNFFWKRLFIIYKVAKYEIRKPSTCRATLFPSGGGGGVLLYKGLMGTCCQPGYVFRDFCLKQGVEFIIFCLNQGIDLSIFV